MPAARTTLRKIRKHTAILGKRLTAPRQRAEMRARDNRLLNVLLDATDAVAARNFTAADRAALAEVAAYRRRLAADPTEISYAVFGGDTTRQVSEIVASASSPPAWGELLYLLAKFTEPRAVFELGTNLGISGSYLLHALSATGKPFHFTSLEGVAQLCERSAAQFATIVDPSHFSVVAGLYQDTFAPTLAAAGRYDLLFIDGDHRGEPTVGYFEALKPHLRDQSLLLFDDIYNNPGMTRAWERIRRDERVTYSVDLYKLGVVVVDENERPQQGHYGLHLSYS